MTVEGWKGGVFSERFGEKLDNGRKGKEKRSRTVGNVVCR